MRRMLGRPIRTVLELRTGAREWPVACLRPRPCNKKWRASSRANALTSLPKASPCGVPSCGVLSFISPSRSQYARKVNPPHGLWWCHPAGAANLSALNTRPVSDRVAAPPRATHCRTPAVHLGCRHAELGRYPQQPVRVFGDMLQPPRWFGNDYAAVGARDQRDVNIRCGRLRVHDERCDGGRVSPFAGCECFIVRAAYVYSAQSTARSRTTVRMN